MATFGQSENQGALGLWPRNDHPARQDIDWGFGLVPVFMVLMFAALLLCIRISGVVRQTANALIGRLTATMRLRPGLSMFRELGVWATA